MIIQVLYMCFNMVSSELVGSFSFLYPVDDNNMDTTAAPPVSKSFFDRMDYGTSTMMNC